MPKMNEYQVTKLGDGNYCVVRPAFPQIGYPESYGSRTHAMKYLASLYAMTLKEYQEYKKGRKKP